MSYNGLLKYRPEIDGLRGISVLLVIFYHFEYKIFNKVIFTGGYIGVDIFFIISGYLITLIILNEKKNSDCFSFKNFYLRRARRILPAFFFFYNKRITAWIFFSSTRKFCRPRKFRFVFPNFFIKLLLLFNSNSILYSPNVFETFIAYLEPICRVSILYIFSNNIGYYN
jgi:peptidoglycan/LPS O-acetylase OafA/YrhL